jgi:hypothetical protein
MVNRESIMAAGEPFRIHHNKNSRAKRESGD